MKAATDITLSLKEDNSLVKSYAMVMFGCLLVHIRLHMNVYSSPSLHNEYLWYDRLWGAFSASSYLVLISFQSCPHHGLDVCWCCSHLVSITYCLQIYNDNKHSKHS